MGEAQQANGPGIAPGSSFAQTAAHLAEIGREFHRRGWALGTSGNFSALVSREPLQLAITATGLDKGALTASHILCVDAEGNPSGGAGRSSSETPLHLAIVRLRGAGAVLHTHSVWSTLLSEQHAAAGGIAVEGYEMLKGLAGIDSHEHREWLPIIENSQNMQRLSFALERILEKHPNSHGLLLRGHGLYSWGEDLAQAKRHVEVIEFLLEVLGRSRGAGAA